MAFLHVGLGLWHKDLRSEVDAIARGIRSNQWHEFGYPSSPQFDAVELQLGSPTLFSQWLNKPYDPWSLTPHNRHLRMEQFNQDFANGSRPDHGRSLEQAVDIALTQLRNRPFMGFHSSDGVYDARTGKNIKCDLGNPDNAVRKLALTKYKNMMDLCAALEANVFVIHPSCHHYWLNGDLGHRKHRMQVFYDNFRNLMQFYKHKNFSFNIAIENLEFDKFPSTAEELGDMWYHCSNIAEQEGVHRSKITMCLDLQHLRHSLSIINEPQNYGKFSNTKRIDDLLKGFPNVHRKFLGISYNWAWEAIKRHDGYDIAHDFLHRYGQFVQVIHTAGNDGNLSATHEGISYHGSHHGVPYFALNHRSAVNALMGCGLNSAIIIEDQSPGGLRHHLNSVHAMRKYIGERL